MSVQTTEFWLALHAAIGGRPAAGALLRQQPNIASLFGPHAAETLAQLLPPERAQQALRARDCLPQARQALQICRNRGWTAVTPDHPCYPAAFRALEDPPLAVFAAGDPSLLISKKAAAVVGTRKPAPASVIAAYRLGRALSENGVVTVSGGALGIDSAAHEGALSGPGTTVAVLGNGLGYNYLNEKRFMRARIQERGLLVTEQFPLQGPTVATFPRRNRLIAALAQTVTVAQSELKGGSMISASYARSYGRKMFVFSGRVCFSAGCESLISKGAVPVADAADVLAFYGVRHVSVPLENDGAPLPRILDPAACTAEEFAALNGVSLEEALPLYDRLVPARRSAPARRQPGAQAKTEPSPLELAAKKERLANEKNLAGDTRAVFLALEDTPAGLDDLAALTGLTPSQVMTAVTLLELEGLVETLPGDRAILKA